MGAADAMTIWTEEGLLYWEANKSKPLADAPTPGEHYVVVEPTIHANYICYPDDPETRNLRHRIVMVKRFRPFVVQAGGTPLPTASLEKEESCRIMCAYMRPWVLHRRYASPHVPHISDLDLKVTDVLEALVWRPISVKRNRCHGNCGCHPVKTTLHQ